MNTGWDCHVHVFDADAPLRPGHYRPVRRTLAEIEALGAAHGLGRLVLVQPSVYGEDHAVLLRALRAGGGRHRGIAVLSPAVDEATLDDLHAAGVRGIRFNLVSPAGHAGDAQADLLALAPRLRARGWHVQWYLPARRLAALVPLQRRCGLHFVLDHLAGLHAGLADDAPEWTAAAELAAGGAWIKLSGWYRLGDEAAPYARLQPAIARAAAVFGPRTVWGSDWPHTAFPPGQLPAYAGLLAPLRDALGDAALHDILHPHAGTLYEG